MQELTAEEVFAAAVSLLGGRLPLAVPERKAS
jgi:hypothetical protein